jgi:hypothetical protein
MSRHGCSTAPAGLAPRPGRRWRAGLGGAAIVLAVALGVPTPGLAAPPGGGGGGPLILEIRPGGGPQRTGELQVVEARVTRPDRDGVDGVVVDFELTEGPGDNDIGTAGHTPETPDMSCTTSGGGFNSPAFCTVEYAEQQTRAAAMPCSPGSMPIRSAIYAPVCGSVCATAVCHER